MTKADAADPKELTSYVNDSRVLTCALKDDGIIPNSPLPLVIYVGAFQFGQRDPAEAIERTFRSNGWQGLWRNGIYTYHHYHSTAHEVLGVYRGSATVRFGGEKGTSHSVQAGDVIIIPAGVSHKNLGASGDFAVVGAYPAGQEVDMCYGRPGERPAADKQIRAVSLPANDPVYGVRGPLREHWAK